MARLSSGAHSTTPSPCSLAIIYFRDLARRAPSDRALAPWSTSKGVLCCVVTGDVCFLNGMGCLSLRVVAPTKVSNWCNRKHCERVTVLLVIFTRRIRLER
eukprot:1626289-Pleurochrysis_carterae.AAC.1